MIYRLRMAVMVAGVDDKGHDLSWHHIVVPVEATSADNAIKQMANALETVLVAERRIGHHGSACGGDRL